MSSLAIQIVIVMGLMLVGIGLMVWSYVNPMWQYADDDESIIPSLEEIDAAVPFAIGALTLVVGWAWGIVLGVIYMAGGG